MLNFKTSNFASFKERMSESIFNWSYGKNFALNVIAPPFCSPNVFLKIIIKFIESKKRVLYITGEIEENIQILNIIKKYTDFRNYCYIRNNLFQNNAFLTVCNYKNAVSLKEKYDLVIYDDINSFPMYNSFEIMDIIIKCVKESGKVICFSIEGIFKNQREILIPSRGNKRPLPEPRYVITRIDLNKEIPFMIYDYLNFSVENDRKVVVYLPNNKDKVHNVFSYLCNFRSSLSKNIMYFISGESDEKILYNFSKIKKAILVTDDYKDRGISLDDTDIIVYFSDDIFFEYKKLVFFSGKVGRSDKLHASEVIFLANDETYEMDKAKNIIRYFNKESWEMGLLDI
jgi:late competence protein required for DNA uptake (superfamily II DNA/RNA helicase)